MASSSSKITKTNFFKLDSNIDGNYIDSQGVKKTIPNMIQSVGSADGPAVYPDSADVNAKLSDSDVSSATNLTNVTNISGHGILYNEKGEPYAYKGDMVLRDGLGNVSSLNKIFLKSNSINEKNKTVFLRDATLQQYNSSNKGVDLNDLIEAAIKRSAAFGVGNVKQAVRNSDLNVDSVSVQTIKMSSGNYIWVVGNAMVTEPTTIQLRDLTTDTILDVSRVEPKSNNITPVYCSYFGNRPPGIDTENIKYKCNDPLWNSYVKRFYRYKDQVNTFSGIHTIALEIIEGSTFIRGSINMLVSDSGDNTTDVLNGVAVINNKLEYDVTFDEEVSSADYGIIVQTETPIQHWYSKDDKTETGFKIKFEREYSGRLLWGIVT